MRSLNGWILCGLLGAAQLAARRCSDRLESDHSRRCHGWGALAPSAVDIALVQVAVHDAVQAIEKRFEPYHVELDRAYGRRSAAVAAAAHDVLVGMYPAQAATLDPIYFSYLADHGLTDDPGLTVGQQAAARILPLRRVNPNPLPPPFVGSNEIGVWRPTPSFLGNPPLPAPFSPMAAPWMGDVRSVHAHEPRALPRRSAAGADERALHAAISTRSKPSGLSRALRAAPSRRISRTSTAGTSRRNGTARCVQLRLDTCTERVTPHGSSRWRTWRSPTPSSPLGQQDALRVLAPDHGHRGRQTTTAIRTRMRSPRGNR